MQQVEILIVSHSLRQHAAAPGPGTVVNVVVKHRVGIIACFSHDFSQSICGSRLKWWIVNSGLKALEAVLESAMIAVECGISVSHFSLVTSPGALAFADAI